MKSDRRNSVAVRGAVADSPVALARRTGDCNHIFEQWEAARRDSDLDPDLSAALKRLDRPFILRDGDGSYPWENFLSFFSALADAVREIDPSLPAGLPPHLLNPKTVAAFFGIPLERMNIQAAHAKSGCLEDRLDCIEAAVVRASKWASLPGAEERSPRPQLGRWLSAADGPDHGKANVRRTDTSAASTSLSNLPDEVTLAEASTILGCDKKTVLKYKEAGLLEWRDIAPPASSRPVYRFKAASVLQHRNAYQTSGPPKAPPVATKVRVSPAAGKYRPTHITVRRE